MSMPDPPREITGDLRDHKHRAPWWAAIITTVVMALGGASGAIINFLDNRDARRVARAEALTEGAVQTMWIKQQTAIYDSEIAALHTDIRVRDVVIDGLKARIQLLEQRQGKGAVTASKRVAPEVPNKEAMKKLYEEELRAKRPVKPSRDDPDVQNVLQKSIKGSLE